MKVYLTRRYRFSASHRLNSSLMNQEENRAVYGKCNNPYGHGHNYTLEVTVSGGVEPATGMVCDLAALDSFIEDRVLTRFHLENLNALDEFASPLVPTTENLCAVIYRLVAPALSGATLERVRIEETLLNSFEYAGGREVKP